jgi:hypothetical protein
MAMPRKCDSVLSSRPAFRPALPAPAVFLLSLALNGAPCSALIGAVICAVRAGAVAHKLSRAARDTIFAIIVTGKSVVGDGSVRSLGCVGGWGGLRHGQQAFKS